MTDIQDNIYEMTAEDIKAVVEAFMDKNSLGTVIGVWFNVQGRAFNKPSSPKLSDKE